MTPFPEIEAARAAPQAMPGHTLPVGTRLREYEIQGLIGEGACSIVYLAWDHALQRKVAVKEYMPASMVGRVRGSTHVVVAVDRHLDAVRAGLKAFINEARLLGRFDHPSLVKVYRFWEENGTGYMVMPYCEGPTLKTALAELGHVPSESELRAWLKPILNALTVLHDGATWHQNIGPDSIVLTPFGPVLLGFAAASHAIEAIRHTPAAALKAGFAAIEQYGSEAGTTRGPWTDLYALAAVVYAAITGSDPQPAADRLAGDRLRPLAVVAAGLYSARFLAAIDAALAVQPRQRPADHTEFRALMGDIEAPEAVSLAPRPDLMQEPFAGAAGDDREITVPDRLPPVASEAPAPVSSAAGSTLVASAPATAEAATTPLAQHGRPAKAKPATARAEDSAPGGTPSWMKAGGARALGKRALYGVIAATCALIGIAALVMQLATRPATRATHAAAASAAAATTTSASASPSPPAAALAVTPPTAASRPPTATVAPKLAAPAPAVAKPTPAPATLAATPLARPATPAPVTAATPLERQARCTEILQKASLEKITPAETEFFKTQCK